MHSPARASLRLDGRCEIGIFLAGNVAPARITKIEHILESSSWPLLPEIRGHQPSKVFRQGEPEGAGLVSGPTM